MPDLVVSSRSAPAPGEPVVEVTPEHGLRYVGFEVHALAPGEIRSWQDPERELCVVFLGGRGHVEAGDHVWDDVGERATVFDGLPHAVYVPAGTACRVAAADAPVEVALAWAPGGGTREPALLSPDGVAVEVRGSGAMERTIHPILMEDRPAESLLVVEVLTPAGHWSSYPPHKHDREAPPEETFLEETYYHRLRPERGFGLQRVYDAEGTLDETLAFSDGDVVLVPRGYHTVSAPPGYDLYYLNVMAGPRREWRIANDPDHAWMLQP